MQKKENELINKFFPKQESNIIINTLKGNNIEVNSKNTNYQTLRRAIRKLNIAKRLLEFNSIKELIRDKRKNN